MPQSESLDILRLAFVSVRFHVEEDASLAEDPAPKRERNERLVLILGAHGQVGRALAAQAGKRGFSHRALGHAECDTTDRVALASTIESACFVVNCAAYTAVDRAEVDAGAAYRVNEAGAENVALACAQAHIPLLHISTDYVFDGESTRPAREDDPTRPLNVYGRSKLAGETAIRTCLPSHIILRTSWIFSAHGKNFLKTILGLARKHPQLRIVDDQIGGPTPVDEVASAILDIVGESGKPGFSDWGTYHFSGTPPVSWYEFATAVLVNSRVEVVPVATNDYPSPARRPLNSVLDCSRIFRVFKIRQPDWRVGLPGVLDAMMAST
jgi:dTDP-4-dehydrorhamnose reductase